MVYLNKPYTTSMYFKQLRTTTLCIIAVLFSLPSIAQNYTLNGDAIALGDDCYQLTDAVNTQFSTVWYNDQIDLTESFDIEFIINLGSNDMNGADGIVFVLQTVGINAIGASGGGIGFEGFAPSFGVEFDTWQNGDFDDPAEDHVAIMQNGDPNHFNANTLSGPLPILPGGANAEDGLDHVIRIEWNTGTQSIDVYVDCILTISLDNYDLVTEIFEGDPNVFFGFTSATGGANNVQTVCLSPNILDVSEDQSICSGDTVQLFAGGSVDGTYEWNPSASLSADDIPNPVAMPLTSTEYVVTFNNLCGFAIIDTILVTVESCFACEPLAGIAESVSPICLGEETLASSTGFNADTAYVQTYLLVANNEILAIATDGEFGVQDLGEYEIYPLNYATLDAPDLDLIGGILDDLTNQMACFELGTAVAVTVETCCVPMGGTAESNSPICPDDEISASSTGFNADADYLQTYLLLANNVILAIAADGEFGVQTLGEYEIYPLNYATADAPDFDLIGGTLDDLTNQMACFELGIAATVTVETCFVCEALGGIAESISPLCSGASISASSTGFNTDTDYAQTHLLVTTNMVVAIADDGQFGVQASGTYEVYPLNYSLIETPDLDLVGSDLNDLTNQTACFELGEATTVTVLNPISISVDYGCDGLTGVYTLSFGFSGGLPEFDNSSPYTASGDLSGEFFITENNQTLTYIDVTPYQLNLEDALGCETSVNDQPEPCIKTAIELLSFSGKTLSAANELNWTTAAEADGDFFVLEKSTDGVNFAPIASIRGNGFSNTTQSYSFLDKDINTSDNYYRLSTFEVGDVLTQKSSIVLLSRDKAADFELYFWNLTDQLSLSINSPQNTTIDIALYNMAGKMVFTSKQQIGAGNNVLLLPINETVSGLYLLSIENETEQIREMIVKY